MHGNAVKFRPAGFCQFLVQAVSQIWRYTRTPVFFRGMGIEQVSFVFCEWKRMLREMAMFEITPGESDNISPIQYPEAFVSRLETLLHNRLAHIPLRHSRDLRHIFRAKETNLNRRRGFRSAGGIAEETFHNQVIGIDRYAGSPVPGQDIKE